MTKMARTRPHEFGAGAVIAMCWAVAACVIMTAWGVVHLWSSYNGPNQYVVRLIEVEGVRCAVLDGYRAGGISCDWEGARNQRAKASTLE